MKEAEWKKRKKDAAQPRKAVRNRMYGEVGNITKFGAPRLTVGAKWKQWNCEPKHVAIGIGREERHNLL